MLSKDAQLQLFSRFCNKPLRKSLNQNFGLENLKENLNVKIVNKKAFSNVIYFDISNFSEKVKYYKSVQIKYFLDEYYTNSLNFIKQYNGRIDKIIGDGIIVVFSKIFGEIGSDIKASDKAFFCCKDLVERFNNTEFEIKAAIGSGTLYFCKTGVEQIYEEYTAVGYPYTVAHRLENIAEKNQILLMSDTPLSKRIKSLEEYSHLWEYEDIEKSLKGVRSNRILKLQY
jgi:hypothetical protein